MSAGGVRLLGGYRVLGRLAQGGMGEILLARGHDGQRPDRLVVIKRLRNHLVGDERAVRRFLEEARIVSRVSHPNVCQVYELGVEDGRHFMVMEYLEGLPLSVILRRAREERRGLDPRAVTSIVEQSCHGMHHVHEARGPDGRPVEIVHRDVSPQNLFVTSAGTVKIVDFGIAKSADSMVHTPAGLTRGKVAYMAPEQMRGGRVDRRTDVHALGLVFQEALAASPAAPEELMALAVRAAAPEPDDRYPDAGQLALAVAAAVARIGGSMSPAELSGWLARRFAEDLAVRAGRVAEAEAADRAGQGGAPVSSPEGGGGRLAPGTVLPVDRGGGPAARRRRGPT